MKNSGALLKGSVLSISLVVMSANVISVLMGDIGAEYPQISRTKLQSFVTIAALAIMVFILLSGLLVDRIGVRKTLLIGLVVYTAGGIAPLFLTDFNLLLASRVVLGAGIGILLPHSVGLITRLFSAQEQAALLGLQFSAGNIGQSVMVLTAGLLASFGWRTSFLVYGLGAVVFFVVLFLIPEPPKIEAAQGKQSKTGPKVNRSVILVALATGFYNMQYATLHTQLALVAAEEGWGDAALVGTAMMFMTLSGMLTGFIFGRFFRLFKLSLGGIAAAVIGVSFGLLSMAPGILSVSCALVLFGFGNSLIMPFANMNISLRAPENATTFGLALLQSSCNLGTVLSPFFFAAVGQLFGRSGGRFTFLFCACVMLLGSAVLLLLAKSSSPLSLRKSSKHG